MSDAGAAVDVAVIGAGIAGASVAADLARGLRVALIERETHAGYHSTGRSAAAFSETYGNDTIRALSRASRGFLQQPPAGFAATPLLRPRGALLIGRADQRERVLAEADAMRREVASVRRVDADFACARVPILRRGYVAAAVHEPESMDIDVHALHQGYLRLAAARGARLCADAEVRALQRDGEGWRLETTRGRWRATTVVNAAGAWGDAIAALAGLGTLGLAPLRRTAMLLDLPPALDARAWPMVIDIDDRFYFKPDGGRLLVSPADATPSPACDAQAEEIDIATGVERVERATELVVRRVGHRWAGLRTFSPDRTPVVGFDARAEGFFWLCGQGGYGIQTAPALAAVAAGLLRGDGVPADIAAQGVEPARLSPRRFAN